MKKILLFAMWWSIALPVFALDASVNYALFNSPAGAYIELNIFVVGKTVRFQAIDSTHQQAQVSILTTFSQGGNVIRYDKYNLESPLYPQPNNFLDVKRYALPNGEYDVYIVLTDLHDTTNVQRFSTRIAVVFPERDTLIGQSDIQLINGFRPDTTSVNNPFVKNGIYLELLPFNFAHKDLANLTFYNEIYNTQTALREDYLLRYYIEQVTATGVKETGIIGHKRRSAKSVDVVLLKMDIAKLPTGNYNLVVEVRDKHQQLYSQRKAFFQRSNPLLYATAAIADTLAKTSFTKSMDRQAVRYALRALPPRMGGDEISVVNLLLQEDNEQAQKNFLFSYWSNQHPNQPERAYSAYMEVAKAVDKMYANGFGYGFESDRGYMYLKYGRPDEIVAVEDEMSAPPYEIWKYNKVNQQTRVKFVFYNPSLGTNDFKLLHSTARGETYNPRWLVDLYRNAPSEISGDDFLNSNQMMNNFNRNAERLFNED